MLADNCASYECTYNGGSTDPSDDPGCLAFNPGTFLSELSWMVYRPDKNTVELSNLPE